jgi:hypothetical protein
MTRQSAYSDDDLLQHAKHFSTRKQWEEFGQKEVAQGKPSHHRVAFKRGTDFYRKCCAHMPHGHAGHTHWQKYPDDELLASARRFQTRGEWKNSENKQHYEMARRRPIWDECVAHMRPAANPFAKDYIVYAYEFSDGYCYVGLTFVPDNRKITHAVRGPVYQHNKVCPNPEFKVLESGLSYTEVGAAESKWQTAYAEKGWKPLHIAKAGSLGSMHRKWTKEAVLAKAKEFQTRKAWYLGSQFTYSLAKREGWFEQAAAHMPRRVLGVGAGREVPQATRDKQAAAKTGVKQSKQHRDSRSAAAKKWWADRRSKPTAESVISPLLC